MIVCSDVGYGRCSQEVAMSRAVLAILVLALTGCGDKDDPTDPADGGDADEDGDGYAGDDDCDDSDPDVNPDAAEICDDIDNDCDDDIDEDPTDGTTWFLDDDGDGYGDVDSEAVDCEPPADSVAVGGDCDDTDPDINPDAEEVCDAVDNDCDGSDDAGLMVPDEHATIQEALDQATDGDLICVAAGTYTETLDFGGVDAEIMGAEGSANTVIDGGGSGPVVSATSDEDAALTGVTVTGGEASKGAGLYVDEANLTLSDVIVSGNSCVESLCQGTGVYVRYGTLTADGSLVTDNHGDTSNGYGAGLAVLASTATLTDSEVSGNTLTSDSLAYGGAVYAGTSSELTLDHVEVSGNGVESTGSSAYAFGGAIRAVDEVDITMDHVRFAANTTGGDYVCGGAALSLREGSDATITNGIFTDHESDCTTGATATFGNSTGVLTVTNTDVVGCWVSASSTVGGAFYIASDTWVVVKNTSVSDCTTSENSKGAFDKDSYGSFTATYSNFYDNGSSPYGRTAFADWQVVIEEDPGYTDTSSSDSLDWDLTLSSSSALIDAGDTSISDADGTTSDIGAYGGPAGADW